MTVLDDDFVTVTEAATLLRVAPSTVRRWIREGDVPAYRLGQRRVAMRRTDLAALISPVRHGAGAANRMSGDERPETHRLTPEEQRQGLAAFERLKKLRQEISAERDGKPFSSSWEILDELRDERTRQLG